jgi:hypothetical protein
MSSKGKSKNTICTCVWSPERLYAAAVASGYFPLSTRFLTLERTGGALGFV